MVSAAGAISPDVLGVVVPALLLAVGVLAAWLSVVTVLLARTRRDRYDGEPVFRRLPDGRIRFTWNVAQQLGPARRQAEARTDPIPRTPA